MIDQNLTKPKYYLSYKHKGPTTNLLTFALAFCPVETTLEDAINRYGQWFLPSDRGLNNGFIPLDMNLEEACVKLGIVTLDDLFTTLGESDFKVLDSLSFEDGVQDVVRKIDNPESHLAKAFTLLYIYNPNMTIEGLVNDCSENNLLRLIREGIGCGYIILIKRVVDYLLQTREL